MAASTAFYTRDAEIVPHRWNCGVSSCKECSAGLVTPQDVPTVNLQGGYVYPHHPHVAQANWGQLKTWATTIKADLGPSPGRESSVTHDRERSGP